MTRASEFASSAEWAAKSGEPVPLASLEPGAVHVRPPSWTAGVGPARRDGDVAPLGSESKDSNPKDAIGVQKLPLSLVPPITIAYGSLAHLNGALKYGKWNWRIAGVRASVYIDAIRRHLAKWEDGEELDEDGVPHLGSIIAGVGIMLDARAAGKLNDDRPPSIGIGKPFDELTPLVKALQARHAGKAPRHFTIADTEKKP